MDSVCGQLIILTKDGSNPIFQLEEGSCTIGSSFDASIRIFANRNVEDIHCIINVKKNGMAILNNKGVEEPVKINGKDVILKKFLKPGDVISIAGKKFQYVNDNIPSNLSNLEKLKGTSKCLKARITEQITRRLTKTPEPKRKTPLKLKPKRSNSVSSENRHFDKPIASPFKTPGRRKSIRVRMANASFNKADLSVSQLLPSKDPSTPQVEHGFEVVTPSSSTRPTLRNEIVDQNKEKLYYTIPPFMKESIIENSDKETQRDLKTPVTEETIEDHLIDFNTPINNTSIVLIENPLEDHTPVRSRKSLAKNISIKRLTQNDETVIQTPNLKTPKTASKVLKTPKSSLRKKRMTELLEQEAICSTPAVRKETDIESILVINDSITKSSSKDIKKSVRISRLTPKCNTKVFPKTPKSDLKSKSLFNERPSKKHSLLFIEESFNENIVPDTVSSETCLDTSSGNVDPTSNKSFVTIEESDNNLKNTPLDLQISKKRTRSDTTEAPDLKKKKLNDEYDKDSFNLFVELSPFKSDDYLEETDKEFSMNDNLCFSNVLVDSPFVNIPKQKAVTEPKKKMKVTTRRSLQDNMISNQENIANMNDSVQSIDTSSFIYMSSDDIKNNYINKSLNRFKDLLKAEVDDTFVNKSRSRLTRERKQFLHDSGGLENRIKTPKVQKEPKNDFCSPRGVKQLMKTPKLHKESSNDLSSPRGVKQIMRSQRVQRSPKNDIRSPRGVKQLMKTPKHQNEPLNDLSSPRGLKQLMKTPKVQKEPLNDLSSPRGVKQIMRSQKVQKSPKNDIRSPRGVKQLMRTLKHQNEPLNDLSSPRGVKQLMKTPKLQKEPLNDLSSPRGVKQIMRSPKVQKSPKNDIRSPRGVKQLMRTPKHQNEPLNDLSSPRGVKQLMKTPKLQKGPLNDLRSPRGIKQIMRSPKVQKSPKNDIRSPRGVKQLMRTPKQQSEPLNDLSSPRGVKQLMKTPKLQKGPLNDLRSPRGIKQIMRSPKVQKSPKNDIRSPRGVKQLMRTPKEHKEPENNLSDFEGVSDLFQLSERKIASSDDLNLSGIEPLEKYIFPNKNTVYMHTPDKKRKLNESDSNSPATPISPNKNNESIDSSRKQKVNGIYETKPIKSNIKIKTNEQNESTELQKEQVEISELENQHSNRKNKRRKIKETDSKEVDESARNKRANAIEIRSEDEEKTKGVEAIIKSNKKNETTEVQKEHVEISELENQGSNRKSKRRKKQETDPKEVDETKGVQAASKATRKNRNIRSTNLNKEGIELETTPVVTTRSRIKRNALVDEKLQEIDRSDSILHIVEIPLLSKSNSRRNAKNSKNIPNDRDKEDTGDLTESKMSDQIDVSSLSKTKSKRKVKGNKDMPNESERKDEIVQKTRSRRNLKVEDNNSAVQIEEKENPVEVNKITKIKKNSKTVKESRNEIEIVNSPAAMNTRSRRNVLNNNSEQVLSEVVISKPIRKNTKKTEELGNEMTDVIKTPVNKRGRPTKKAIEENKQKQNNVSFEEILEEKEVKKPKRIQRKRATSPVEAEIKSKKLKKEPVQEAPVIRKSARLKK